MNAKVPETVKPADTTTVPGAQKTKGTASTFSTIKAWSAGVLATLLVLLLLFFIFQNPQSTQMRLFFWELNFRLGVGMLCSAIIGALLAVIIGGFEIVRSRIRR